MVKFIAMEDGVPTLGMGLSRANLIELRAGHPILFDLGELGWALTPVPRGTTDVGQVLIMAGETEQDIGRTLGIEAPQPGSGEQTLITRLRPGEDKP